MDTLHEIKEILGGEAALGRSLTSADSLARLSREGVPLRSVRAFASTFGLAYGEVVGELTGAALSHPSKILGELWDGELSIVYRLGPDMSRNFVDCANVFLHGRRVFGSDNELMKWMRTEQPVLRGRRPIEFLYDPAHREEVGAVLTRIEHGVFA